MMHKPALCLLFATTLLSAGEDDWSLNSAFSFWGEYVTMRRSDSNNQKLVLDQSQTRLNTCGGCVPKEVCETKKVAGKMGFEPGYRIGASYITAHTTWEATYLEVGQWHGRCHAHSPGSLYFSENHPNFSHDFAAADSAEVTYKSRFQNGEFNFLRHSTPPRHDYFSGSWLIGGRYIHLVESFEVEFEKTGSHSSYDVHAGNVLLGLQVGGGFQWNPTKSLSWDLLFKGAGFYNWAKEKTFVGDYNNTVTLRDFEVHDHAWPFVIDLSLNLAYQIFEYMNVHAGYQMIYLNTVALASDQLVKDPSSDSRPVRTNGEILIYGFYAGLTFCF